MQAWRWNLDYVTDSHSNAMAYFYNTETNYYAADNGTRPPQATRRQAPSPRSSTGYVRAASTASPRPAR